MTNKLDRSRSTDPFANEWGFPKAARHLSHGRILPMAQPRRPLLERIFGTRP